MKKIKRFTLSIFILAIHQFSFSFTDNFSRKSTFYSDAQEHFSSNAVVIAQGTVVSPSDCASTDGTMEINGNSLGLGTIHISGAQNYSIPNVNLPYLISGVHHGNFTINFEDNLLGFSNDIQVNIDLIIDPISIILSGNDTICQGQSVGISASTFPNITWSNGMQAQQLFISTSGSFYFTYSDGFCVQNSDTVAIVVLQATISPGLISNTSTCGGADGVFEILGLGQGNLTVSGNAINQTIPVSLPYTFSTLSAGYYEFNFETYSCLSNTLSTFVLEPSPTIPTITILGNDTICPGETTNLQSSIANVSWSTGENTDDINVNSGGSYTLFHTDLNNCSASTTVQIVEKVLSNPQITSSESTNFCIGDTIILTSSLPDITWSNGQTTQSISVSNSGSFYITVAEQGCTLNSSTISTTVNQLPLAPTIISFQGDTTICQNSPISLVSSALNNNLWSNGQTFRGIIVQTSGDYFVRVVDVNGCMSTTSDTITVTVIPTPIFTIGNYADITTCFAKDGSVEIIGTPSAPGTLYWKEYLNGVWSSNYVDSVENFVLGSIYSGLEAGIFRFAFDNGCAYSTNQAIQINEHYFTPSSISYNQTEFCAGDSLLLYSTFGVNNLTWSSGETTPSIWVKTAGDYYILTHDGACFGSSDTISIFMKALPNLNAGADFSACNNTNVVLSATTDGTAPIWNYFGIYNDVPFNFNAVGSRQYICSSELNGCFTEDTIEITGIDFPLLNYSYDQIISTCGGSDGAMIFTGNGTGVLTWNGTNSGSVNLTLPDTVGNFSAGSYSFMFNSTCPSNIVNATFSDPGFSPPTIISSQTVACEGDSILLKSSIEGNNLWSTGQTADSIYVFSSGAYFVSNEQQSCVSNSQIKNVTFYDSPVFNFGIVNNPSTCATNDGLLEIIGTEYSTIYINKSNDIDTVFAYLPFTLTNLSQGNYQIFVEQNGCLSEVSIIDLVEPNAPIAPTITASGNTTICEGEIITLTSSVSTGNLWSTGETSESIQISSAGIYILQYEQNGCLSNSADEELFVNPIPTYTITGISEFCEEDSTIITISANGSVNWFDETTIISKTFTESTNYWFFIDNGTCKTDTIIGEVEEILVSINLISDLSICDGSTLNIPIEPSYFWMATSNPNVIGETTSQNSSSLIGDNLVLVSNQDSIEYQYFNTAGQIVQCPSDTLNFIVTVNNLTIASFNIFEDTLKSQELGTYYQWMNCDNGIFTPINGANSEEYLISQSGGFALLFENQFGCIDTSDCMNVSLSNTGIVEIDFEELMIFPNPVKDLLYLSSSEEIVLIQLFDLAGKLVLEQSTNFESINFMNLEKGSYVLNVFGENKFSYRNIIKI